mgnify:CR=1 FL=1
MYFSFALWLIFVFTLYKLFGAVKSSKAVDSPPLYTFDAIKAVTILYIAVPIVLLTFAVVLSIQNGISYLSMMGIVCAVSLCAYSLFLVFISSKITADGMSVRLHGSFTWEEINKIEITDKHIIVHHWARLPFVHIVRKFKIRLPQSALDELSDLILKFGINRKVIYIKS